MFCPQDKSTSVIVFNGLNKFVRPLESFLSSSDLSVKSIDETINS